MERSFSHIFASLVTAASVSLSSPVFSQEWVVSETNQSANAILKLSTSIDQRGVIFELSKLSLSEINQRLLDYAWVVSRGGILDDRASYEQLILPYILKYSSLPLEQLLEAWSDIQNQTYTQNTSQFSHESVVKYACFLQKIQESSISLLTLPEYDIREKMSVFTSRISQGEALSPIDEYDLAILEWVIRYSQKTSQQLERVSMWIRIAMSYTHVEASQNNPMAEAQKSMFTRQLVVIDALYTLRKEQEKRDAVRQERLSRFDVF